MLKTPSPDGSVHSLCPVHVLAAPYRVVLRHGATLSALSQHEVNRHNALKRDEDRERFLAAHTLKRQVLSHVRRAPPERLSFITTQHGKPELQDKSVSFNLSHGGEWICLALHPSVPVGVDVEMDRPSKTWEDILPHVATTNDAPLLPLATWTAKEALLKCLGTGFRKDPRDLRLRSTQTGFTAQAEPHDLFGIWHPLPHAHMLAVTSPIPYFEIATPTDSDALDRAIALLPMHPQAR